MSSSPLYAAAVAGSSNGGGGGGGRRHRDGSAAGAAALIGAMAAMNLSEGGGAAECKAPRRNIHDFYKIVEKPIGSGGFGVVSTYHMIDVIKKEGRS